jgi:brefeldin A-inhibited guanine nucleotide-exchange protein
LALKNFQHEEWPPKVAAGESTTGAVASETKAVVGEAPSVETEETEETSKATVEDAATEKQVESGTETTDDDGKKKNGDETESDGHDESKPPATEEELESREISMGDGSDHSASAKGVPPPDMDDPQTREPVHPAVVQSLEAVQLVLQHPTKLPRPCEVALEAVMLLVKHRYVSGRAGCQGSDEAEEPSLLHRLLESVSKCSDSNVEPLQVAVIQCLQTILTSPKCAVHCESMLLALRSTFHVYLVTKSQTTKDLARSALTDMLRAVFFRMEAHDAMLRTNRTEEASVMTKASDQDEQGGESPSRRGVFASSSSQSSKFASQYHADAYYLFRSLCKLSSKELPADNADEAADRKHSLFNTSIPTDPTELNSKILSLELILAGMEYTGEGFMQEKFLYLIQHYLCVSLLKNCISNHTQVAYLSQKIFLQLVYKFKGQLKQDIEVFMSNVFFRVLESQNSSFKQKALVLESLRSLCRDPVLLTQIFLNYDCDFDAMNLYKDIVHMLTKLGGKATSIPSSSASKRDVEQEFELSLAALECLVTILKAFLRALGLPGADDGDMEDTAGSRIRGMLQLDAALAPQESIEPRESVVSGAESVVSDDVSSQGLQPPSAAQAAVDSLATVPVQPGSTVANKIVNAFDRKQKTEQNFEIGAVKFTLSLKTGLNFFIDNGFVERDARQVALFFLTNKDKLDKTQIGEALGREPDSAFVKGDGVNAEKGGPGFWMRILHHYVDALDFTDLLFDEAIRLFLSGFRLPGEAQKIDRIMEKFAERFTSLNPKVFTSSDTAFILAFSVIMLQTDLHNPSIKEEKKMTVESFLSNNRGIGENGSDLPEDFLRGIYGRIKERPFSLKEDDAAREKGAQKQIFDTSVFFERATLFGGPTSAEERKRENFKKERDEMMAATEQLIRRRPEKTSKSSQERDSSFTENIAPAEVVKPMFDVTWGPMIGILSQVLECADDERSVAVCLNGFVFAVRLASHGSMSLARDTFVSSLAKFTYLGSIKEMQRKNVESIRTLLSIAVVDGEFLGESWGPVLQCISQLARLRLSASGLDSDESFLMAEAPKTPPADRSDHSTKGSIFRQPTPGEVAREAQEINGKAVLEAVSEVLIDKVFSSTVKLSAKSLVHFIEQLISVSSSEISGTSKSGITGVMKSSRHKSENSSGGEGPSIFSLQRLVDVADYNMDVRPRLVWAQIWEVMADFFIEIASHQNRMVSFFAIDSLKQLSLKFLEKPELSEFNFQCSFLRPFLVVMKDSDREESRELILQCVDNIVRAKAHNLRSGWKIVFSILSLSAGDASEKIEYLGLIILQRLLDDHLDDLGSLYDKHAAEPDVKDLSSLDKLNRNANADDFVCLCKASLAFITTEGKVSMRPFASTLRAFCHTAIYADLLAAGRVLPPVSGAQVS